MILYNYRDLDFSVVKATTRSIDWRKIPWERLGYWTYILSSFCEPDNQNGCCIAMRVGNMITMEEDQG